MSYESKSVRELIERINAEVEGWFLPATQRPYVWGSRYESELYICKLFNSLLRAYPIGALIVWKTSERIPYREFMREYSAGQAVRPVQEGHRPDKSLVYDGQQRLQTLYSCLRYTFNSRILVFNLLYDLKTTDRDQDETGFAFIDKGTQPPATLLRMDELSLQTPDAETSFEDRVMNRLRPLEKATEDIVKFNLRQLWKIFVERDKKSIAYFPIVDKNEDEVNEIFQRVNTGGIPLSQADLLLSKIKEKYPEYEEGLEAFSKEIFSVTNNGYVLSSYDIFQLVFLIHTGTSRIDPKRISSATDIEALHDIGEHVRDALLRFFGDFLWGQLKINNAAIVPRRRALLPMLVYFHTLAGRNVEFRRMEDSDITPLRQYLILSQINDWNLQTIVDRFAAVVKQRAAETPAFFRFPLDEFIAELNRTQRRPTDLTEARFTGFSWFSLKVLTPNRVYCFDPDPLGQRFNPEIDHIFPGKLLNQSEEYYRRVDDLWNKQPVKGEVNNYKRRRHPREFLLSGDGKKYLGDYDFLPDLDDHVWDSPLEFIDRRKEKMIQFLEHRYELKLVRGL